MTGDDHGGAVDPSTMDLGALDLLPEAVVLVAADGTVTHCNDRARALLGVDDDSAGRLLTEVVELRDDTGQVLTHCLIPEAATVPERIAERVLYVTLDGGRTRPLAVAGRLSSSGAALTFRHAGRRERLDAARSDLVATVSHEIRSPLTSVKGFTRTLLSKWDRFSDEQKRQMLATINADADRVTRLLTELLDVSRIDAGRVRLERRMIDLGPILERVVEKVAHTDEDREVHVRTQVVPSVYADPDKIEQVVTNLVNNALSHAPDGPVRVLLADDGDAVRITVSDEGPGIPRDQHRSIFGKFSRGRDSRRAGTGLGLYITKGLVEAHGGRMWLDPDEDEGATFHVRLPAGEPDLGGGGARAAR